MRDSKAKSANPLLQNAKARVFIALALLVVVVGAIAFVIHWRSRVNAERATAAVSGAPNIGSVPGAGNPSAAYIKAQTQANIAGEEQARKSATAFVPTITRTGFVGNPDQFGQTSDASHCPINKVVMTYKPNPASCLPDNLKLARETGVTAEELMCQGCSCPALKLAGFTVGDLKQIGLTATQLHACGFDLQDLVNAGFSAADLKDAGYNAQQLKAAGFTAGELKDAGFSPQDLKAAGYPASAAPTAQCNPAKLKQEQADGVSAAVLKAQGCSIEALKAAGYTAEDLKNAGFGAAALKDAGFTAAQLKKAGFSAADLKKAGFTAGQLVDAGYSPKELRDAGFSAKQLRQAGVSASALRAAGFSAAALKAAGFTKGDLLRAGFPAQEVGYAATAEPTTTDLSAPASEESLPSIGTSPAEARLAQFEKQQQTDMTAQQRQNHIQQMEAAMNGQAHQLLTGWSNVTTQQFQLAPPPTKSITTSTTSAAAANAVEAAADGGPVIKAGTVLFATIGTSINSDENTPIMAKIVTGELNGSTLLGTFNRQHKRLLITFNLLSSPEYPKSIPVNAVAIDPDTARTALSGQVNSHYLLRYGTLFAASFLQGVSDAIINQDVVEHCLVANFGCTVTQSPLDSQQQVKVGLGKVGQQYAQHMGSNFNRAPTIRVAAGTGIGVLIMSDLTLPTNVLPDESQGE